MKLLATLILTLLIAIAVQSPIEEIKRLPKVELHVHMEGSIPPSTLLQLIRKHDPENPIRTVDDLRKKISFKTFDEFIAAWMWMCQFVKEYEDFQLIAFDVLKTLHEQNVKYVELTMSPPDFHKIHGLEIPKIVQAVLIGAKRAKDIFGIRSNFIVDLCRQYGAEQGFRTLNAITPFIRKPGDENPGVIALNLGGPEFDYPPYIYREVMEEARRRGLNVTVHAGEAAPFSYVWEALVETKAARIGHGIESVKDPRLMEYLKRHRVPIDVCPTSNVKTQVLKPPKLENHPIRQMFDYGLFVTLNSDDPLFFERYILDEMIIVHQVLNFTVPELKQMMRNAVEASFLTQPEKRILIEQYGF